MTNYINITSVEQLKAALTPHRPHLVCYYQNCPESTRLNHAIRELEQRDELNGVTILRVPVSKLPSDYLQRRALNRLPAVAFHNGVFEHERLTGYTSATHLIGALVRLCRYMKQEQFKQTA